MESESSINRRYLLKDKKLALRLVTEGCPKDKLERVIDSTVADHCQGVIGVYGHRTYRKALIVVFLDRNFNYEHIAIIDSNELRAGQDGVKTIFNLKSLMSGEYNDHIFSYYGPDFKDLHQIYKLQKEDL